MEIRVNVAIAAILGLVWLGVSASDPVAALDPQAARTRRLAELEDRFAHRRSDPELARKLARRYLDLGRPGHAIATLRSADPSLLDHPMVAHHLAKAYEVSGRMLDALATAKVARARCGRSVGTGSAAHGTPVPGYDCDAHEYARLDAHYSALSHMVRWGVSDPKSDSRTELAYELATRSARIASAEQ